jgi:Amt family ammonium transporter
MVGVGLILVNTVLGGSAGCLTALAAVWARTRLPLLSEMLSGGVRGLVAVTAACHAITLGKTLIAGAGGGVMNYSITLALSTLKIDKGFFAVFGG